MGLRVVKDGTAVAGEVMCMHHLQLHLDKCCMYMLEAVVEVEDPAMSMGLCLNGIPVFISGMDTSV